MTTLLDFADLLERCRVKGVRVRLVQEGEIDWTSATGRAFANMAATFAQFERELAVERNQAAVAERKDRGDHLGQAPYGWTVVGGQLVKRDDERPDLVFEAFRQGGSFAKAARLLNEWGVPTRRQGTRWIHGTVADIVRQQGPHDLGPALVKRRGASPLAGAMFAGLLRCPCGATLTPRKDVGAPSGVSGYYCSRSSRTPGHGRMHVAERPVLEWAKTEAARYPLPDEVDAATSRSDERAGLEAERQQATRLGLVPGADLRVVEERLAELDAALAAIDEEPTMVEVGPIDWESTPPAALNKLLRTYWFEVKLDEQLRPVSAEWRIRRMRESVAA
jgi:hypothetical protein